MLYPLNMIKGKTRDCALSLFIFLFLSSLSFPPPRVAEDLKRCHSEAALLRHTLQCLIAGSGVDWAEDETLLQLTLSLGTHPQT